MSQSNSRGNSSIRSKILFCCLLLGIMPLAISGALAVSKAFKSRESAEGQVLQGSAEQVIDKIDRMLFERYGDVQSFAFHPSARGTADQFTVAANFFMQAYGTYDLMVLADKEGKIVAANTVDAEGKPLATKPLVGLSVAEEPWFKECISGNVKPGESYSGDLSADPWVAEVYHSQGLTLNFSAPVFGEDGIRVAVWSNRASWVRTVRDLLGGLDKAMKDRGAKSFEILVASKDRQLLEEYPNSRVGTAGAGASIKLPETRAQTGFFSAKRGKSDESEVVGFANSVGIQAYKGHGWTLVVREPSSDALAEPRALRSFFIILGLISVVAVWIVSSWLASSIAGPLNVALSALDRVAQGDLTPRLQPTGNDEIARMCRALDNALDSIGSTLKDVGQSAQTLAGASSELSAISSQLSSGTQRTAAQATVVDDSSSTVSQSVSNVATATEEMAVSVREISRNASEATRIAGGAVEIAQASLVSVNKLSENSAQIGKVSETINKIAKQTNLLALNATIEAARAGEAGKGFAVVAEEVKSLANATAAATLEIEKQIHQVQEDSTEVSMAIGSISEIINQIAEFQTSIAAAVEEQGVTTESISRTIAESARSTSDISMNIGGIAKSLEQTSGSAAETRQAAEELSRISEHLQASLSQFRI